MVIKKKLWVNEPLNNLIIDSLLLLLIISDVAQYVNLQGRVKSSKKYAAEIKFDFQIDSVGKLDKKIKLGFKIRKVFHYSISNSSVPDR